MFKRPLSIPPIILLLIISAITACDSNSPGLTVRGRVTGGDVPISGATVTLYATGTAIIETLGSAVTDGEGNFKIRGGKPSGSGIIYVIARGGRPLGNASSNDAIALMTVIGRVDRRPDFITVNELTTIASVWTNAQFLDGNAIIGNASGVDNAAGNVGNIADIEIGGLGDVILNGVNGSRTSMLARVNTLANIIASCVTLETPDACGALFAASTPPGGRTPSDTLQAAHNIALNPWNNIAELYALSIVATPYVPALNTPPGAWTIALKFTGGGLDAPGGISIDENGNVWATNNFLFGSQSDLADCPIGGIGATKLAPDGTPLSPTFGFSGGGIDGAGFGIAVDQTGNIWIGNFQGDRLSLLAPDGTPLSPDGAGFTAGGTTSKVQGTIVDFSGNIWFVNNRPAESCPECGNSLTIFPGGDPEMFVTFSFPGTDILDEPFDVALDLNDNLWITNGRGNTVTQLDQLGNPLFQTEEFCCGISEPKAMAIDSLGNVWVSNLTGVIDPRQGTVTLLDPFGANAPGSPFTGGGITGPWGIAVDGDDNIWVADFLGKNLVNLCGVRTENCPPGLTTGDPITPETGYTGGGALQHLTAVEIDQSGNVWVANNVNDLDVCFKMSDIGCMQMSTECGGDGLVVFYGLAAPVETPLIGPPRQP